MAKPLELKNPGKRVVNGSDLFSNNAIELEDNPIPFSLFPFFLRATNESFCLFRNSSRWGQVEFLNPFFNGLNSGFVHEVKSLQFVFPCLRIVVFPCADY